jgi:molybdate transport system permease protein
MDVWHITWFTVACALAATLLILPAGVLVAWLLARRRFPGRALVETLVSLPLVMPPVATGLLLLMLFGRRGTVGRVLERLGIEVVFTWKAVVLAMAIMGLPLLVRTARAGFEQVNARYERVAATLGARPLRVFFTISLPLAWPSVLGGAILAFARALGEFGATIVVAGSIPGVTRTLAVGIYSHAETGQDAQALVLVAISVTIAFGSLWLANVLTELAPPKRYREGGGPA